MAAQCLTEMVQQEGEGISSQGWTCYLSLPLVQLAWSRLQLMLRLQLPLL